MVGLPLISLQPPKTNSPPPNLQPLNPSTPQPLNPPPMFFRHRRGKNTTKNKHVPVARRRSSRRWSSSASLSPGPQRCASRSAPHSSRGRTRSPQSREAFLRGIKRYFFLWGTGPLFWALLGKLGLYTNLRGSVGRRQSCSTPFARFGRLV